MTTFPAKGQAESAWDSSPVRARITSGYSASGSRVIATTIRMTNGSDISRRRSGGVTGPVATA